MALRSTIQKIMATRQNAAFKKPFTIAVEGNIGSGKTTFLEHLNKLGDGNIAILAEPVESWRNCDGHNLLSLLYQDPKKWGFTFQSYVQLTMLNNHIRRVDAPIKIMERSIYSARWCFVEKMKNDGVLPMASFAVVHEWFQWLCDNRDLKVDMFVYLRTSPEVAYNRVMQRNREEEKTVSFEHIQSMHEIHEKWLYHKTLCNCVAPVMIIDANSELSDSKDTYTQFAKDILKRQRPSIEA